MYNVIMKYAIIDIGSNSVRLMISQDLVTIEKQIETTALGQGLQKTHCLSQEAMARTRDAIVGFEKYAREIGCENFLCFATEAVRSASNGLEFVKMLASDDIHVDVIAGDMEARLGFFGAYTQDVCCVVDIGGASTELSVGHGNDVLYSKSLPIGLVRIKDACGENIAEIEKYVVSIVREFGQLPPFDHFLGIGGTPTSFVAIINKLAVYDRNFVDMKTISREDILKSTMIIGALNMEARLEVDGLHPKRRDVIVGGGILLASIMQYIGVENITARESDNLEGYLKHYLGMC